MKICHLLQEPVSEKAYESILEAIRNGHLRLVKSYGSQFDLGNGNYVPLYTYSDGYRVLYECRECGAYILKHVDEYHDCSMPAGDEDTELYVACGGLDDAEDLNRNNRGIEGIKALNRKCLEVLLQEKKNWQNPMIIYR